MRARCDACTAANAGSEVKRLIRDLFRNRDGVGIRRTTRADRHIAAGLNDSIQRRTDDDEVLDQREAGGAPRLDDDLIAVGIVPHMQLARGCPLLRSMRLAVDDHPARSADTFSAVVIELDRVFAFLDELLVQYVEQFEERHIGISEIGRAHVWTPVTWPTGM